jgi:hypothetical protein
MRPAIAESVQAWRASRRPPLPVSRVPLVARGCQTAASGMRACVGVEVRAPALDVSALPGCGWQLSFVLTVSEQAGVGADLAYVRMELYTGEGKLLESVATGASVFAGGGRLDAGATRDFLLRMGFDMDPLAGRSAFISVGARDDCGHSHLAVSQRLSF